MSETLSPTRATNAAEYSVSEISGALKRTVEEAFGNVRVRGEISGYRGPHSSGHAYFALKDERARIEAVIWKGTMGKMRFRPEEGMEVIAGGRLTTFPGSSKYQIVIETLEPAGAGALMALLDERKRKLAAEGLFEASRKRPLPFLPRVIGVVTSPTGAVIRDILHRIADRFPLHVIVWPVRVQGETTGAEVSAAVAGFNALTDADKIARPDLLIVARGGGSLEDLWGFNDENLARTVAASRIPVISAVGHETDWTLIDLAADRRAPTPTGAAEMAVPVKAELEAAFASLSARLRAALTRLIDRRRQAARAATRALPAPDQLLALPRRSLDEASSRLERSLTVSTRAKRARFVAARLNPGQLSRKLEDTRRSLSRTHDLLIRAEGAARRDKRRLVRHAAQRLTVEPLRRRLGEAGRASFRLGEALRRARQIVMTRRADKAGLIAARLRLQPITARVETMRVQLDVTATGLARSGRTITEGRTERLSQFKRLLDTLSYRNVLARGFAVVQAENGRPITSAAATAPGQHVAITFADGRASATISLDEQAQPKRKAAARASASSTPNRQGSLF